MKILIIKTSSLGDIIHVYPVISYLKHKFPEAAIDWVVESSCADLVKSHPFVRRILCINTRSWRKAFLKQTTWKEVKAFKESLQQESYDYVFDLQGNIKSGLVTFLAKGNKKIGFALGTAAEWPNILATNQRFTPPEGHNIRQDYLFLAEQCFHEVLPLDTQIALSISNEQQQAIQKLLAHPAMTRKMKILVCPGSAWKNKQMSMNELLKMLHKFEEHYDCYFLLAWGSQEEKNLAAALKEALSHCMIIDRLSLPALQNLMRAMDLVVAMDSLPLHLAGTTGVPTFSVFGPSSAEKYKPLGEYQIAFQGSCPYGRTFKKRCPILRTCPTGSCIRGLDGEKVFAHFIRHNKTSQEIKDMR